MQRVKLPQIQGHYLTLALKDSILTLEVEEESSGRIFSLDLDEDSIDQVTDGLFQTAEDLFRGLQDGANNRCPRITLALSKGKLIYTVVLSTETVQRESFILNLTEKRVDQVEVLERKFEQWKERYEAKNEDLMKQMEQKMAQRLDILEKLCDNLKVLIPPKLDFYFNKDSMNASKFVLTDENKTVTSISSDFPGLEILPRIPSSGQSSYSLRINNITNNCICFGITNNIGWWNYVQEPYIFLLRMEISLGEPRNNRLSTVLLERRIRSSRW